MKSRYIVLILFLVLLLFHGSEGDDAKPTIGQMIRSSDSSSDRATGSSHFTGEPGILPVQQVVQQVSDSALTAYVTRLESFRTRYTYSDSVFAASSYIHDAFSGFGYSDVSYDSFNLSGITQRNVVAVKPGTLDPDRVILVGGHYDSIVFGGAGCDPDTLAPGADDNASGVAVAMEAARVLAEVETDLTVIFVAFAGEEQGLFGSTHFAEEAFDQGMDIRVVLNSDEVGHASDPYWNTMVNTGNTSSPYIHIEADIAREYTNLIPVLSFFPVPGSDHHPFYLLGYDYVLTHDGDESPYIHQCSDTIEHMSIPLLTDVARLIAASTLYMANMPEIPAGLDVVNAGDGSTIVLRWEANGEPDLSGYNIYYGTAPGSYDSLVTVGPAVTSDTLFNLVEGTDLYAGISAFDIDDYESPLTPEAHIVVSSLPSAPSGLSSVSLEASVFLEWDRSTDELDIEGYSVYRYPADDPHTPVLIGFVADPETTYMDETAYPHTLYGYVVTAVDTEDPPNESEPSSPALARLATHDMGILVIDNTRDGMGNPMNPTDVEVDDFYDAVLAQYDVRSHWDVDDSLAVERPLMDFDIGIYSSVIWHSDVRNGQAMAPDTSAMRIYMNTGGRLWLSGWMLIASLTGESGPSFVFDPGDFVSTFTGIDSARTTSSNDVDFIGAEGTTGEFERLLIDPDKVPLPGLFNMDVLYPPFSGTYPIYTYISSDSTNSAYHGLPTGLAGESSGQVLVFTDFPLFFMEETDVRSLVGAVMYFFGEPVGVEDEDRFHVPRSYALDQNFPNPFNPMTTITFDIPGEDEEKTPGKGKVAAKLSIFDLRGRLVKLLFEKELPPGRHQVTWDGRNATGTQVPSGIYFYRLTAGDFSSTRKMTLVR